MVYIIAEAGVNHNGDVNKAKELVDIAKKAGVNCIKFQTFKAEKIVTRNAKKADYQVENTKNNDSQFEMLKKLELSDDEFRELKDYCDSVGIDFLSTPFDEEAVDLLENLGVNAYKIPSGEITNKPLIQYIASKKKRMMVSTGMCTLSEVQDAVQWIEETGNRDITLFHCTSNYPAPYDAVNMKAMWTLRDTFPYPVGYSDHTQGIEIPVMAVAMGASVIEKHFTYDVNAEGPDHKASLSPEDLQQMVREIRHVEKAFGDGEKVPTEAELSTRVAARKSLVYARDLKPGDTISREDICCKRPGNGIQPAEIESFIGKKISVSVKRDTLAKWEDIQ